MYSRPSLSPKLRLRLLLLFNDNHGDFTRFGLTLSSPHAFHSWHYGVESCVCNSHGNRARNVECVSSLLLPACSKDRLLPSVHQVRAIAVLTAVTSR